MASAREHYDQHLGPIYSWMGGGIESAFERGAAELDMIGATASSAGDAIDLGAGFGMHAVPLARRGYNVLAVDTCAPLLEELRVRTDGLPVRSVQDDLNSFSPHLSRKADLVLCMGDTLTHLTDEASVEELFATVSSTIRVGGRFVITLRDYSTPLVAEHRFIPVRSDENRILTCFLEYRDSHVRVHDLLHERDGSHWSLRISSYDKLRLSPDWLTHALKEVGFKVSREAGLAGMIRLVADRL